MNTDTLDRDFAEQRLQSTIDLVKSLSSVDWPYSDGQVAINGLLRGLQEELLALKDLDRDSPREVIAPYCFDAREKVSRYSGYLGFIVRSADLRNSFEIYQPIKEIGNALLGRPLHIILGSEWNYRPFLYPLPENALSDFIFVGLPAAEAQNALLLPVAGHELGHAVWRKKLLFSKIGPKIQENTIRIIASEWGKFKHLFPPKTKSQDLFGDLDLRTKWREPHDCAARQCEEVFCDLVGAWIFGESFLHAFQYLLSPDRDTRQSKFYPSSRSRAEFLASAAEIFGHNVPPDFVSNFLAPEMPSNLWLQVADRVTKALVPELVRMADEICRSSGLRHPDTEVEKKVQEHLASISPATGEASVAEILNAAWDVRLNFTKWEVPGVDYSRKLAILNDLVLKSLEVLEWAKLEKSNTLVPSSDELVEK